jgi:hypothetical protein
MTHGHERKSQAAGIFRRHDGRKRAGLEYPTAGIEPGVYPVEAAGAGLLA